MSLNFGQPLPNGPTATTPIPKDIQVKVVKLTSADFSTGGTTALKAVLPADASIVSLRLWNKVALSGGGVTAATVSVGTPASSTNFVNASTAAFGAANTFTLLPAANIMQDYQIPWGADIQITVTGTATTGNPTAGEMYLVIEFVR